MSLFQVTKKQVIENYELRTMTGDIVSFTPSYSQLLPDPFSDLNVTVNVLATGGNGTPDNPNPINGYTEANITRCGVNLFDSSAFVDSYPTKYETTSDGSIQTISNNTTDDILWSNTKGVSGSISITFISKYENTGSVGIRPKILYTDGTMATIYPTNTQDYHTETFTTYNNKTVEKIVTDYGTFVNKTNFYMQVELSATPTEYHAYNEQTYTIAFGQTVYGGVLDVTRGKLHVTWTNAVDLGSLGWSYDIAQQVFVTTDFVGYKNGTPFLCDIYTDLGAVAISQITNYGGTLRGAALYIKNTDYTDAPTFKTAMNGKYITAELATPFDIDLTPEVISAIVGENNVFADCGDVTVTCLI